MPKWKRKLVLLLCLPSLYSKVIKPGLTGRYCAKGEYDINSGHLYDYNADHWCGLHEIDFRACVSISYPDNTTRMGCDNDGGIFPTCSHDYDSCYLQGNAYICCCNSDHCNDCSKNPYKCIDPLAIGTPTTTKRPNSCPSGSVNWQKNCYFFQTNQAAFLVAEKSCNDLGGHLASIHDEFANSFIAQYGGIYFKDNTNFWIGGTDLTSQYYWSWTDGSVFSYTQWRKGDPGNPNGHCISLSITDGTWSSTDCFKHQPSVCIINKN
jgi:hypothetical protein